MNVYVSAEPGEYPPTHLGALGVFGALGVEKRRLNRRCVGEIPPRAEVLPGRPRFTVAVTDPGEKKVQGAKRIRRTIFGSGTLLASPVFQS